jgi:hypothetical protein
MMRDVAVHWRRGTRDFIVKRKRGRIIAVVDEIADAWRVAEEAQAAVNEGRAAAEASRKAEAREKMARMGGGKGRLTANFW